MWWSSGIRRCWRCLDGRDGHRGGAPVSGWRGRRCTAGCAGMPPRWAGRVWPTGRRGRRRVRIRCRRGRGADRGAAAGASGVGSGADRLAAAREGVEPLPGRSAVYRASGAPWPGRGRRSAAGGGRTTGGGSGAGRWSCGRWTSWAGCTWPTAASCKVVTGIDDHSRFCVCAQAGRAGHGPAGVRGAALRRCAAMGCRSRS